MIAGRGFAGVLLAPARYLNLPRRAKQAGAFPERSDAVLTNLFYATIAVTAWVALIYCAYEAARGWAEHLNARQLDGQDSFTPSMARWGYVNEKRGAK